MSLIDEEDTPKLDQNPEAAEQAMEVVSHPTSLEPKRQKRLVVDDLYHYGQVSVKSAAMEQAEEFQSTLPSEFPTFLKTMVRSNVTTGFWLHLPMPFCKLHMPRHNAAVSLEDENGQGFELNYIVDKTALSAGWKKFTAFQKLAEGDVLVFQMFKPSAFKVYTFRANESPGDDEARDLDSSINQILSENKMNKRVGRGQKTRKISKPVSLNRSLIVVEAKPLRSQHGFRAASDDLHLEATDGDGDFTILVNGKSINSDLSEVQRMKYHELCSAHKSILHENLVKNIGTKLAVEMISETVRIADAIRSIDLSTSQAEITVWDRTLEGFEVLGMKVGFLRNRLHELSNLAMEIERCRDGEIKQGSMKEEVRTIKAKLLKLKRRKRKLGSVIADLKESAEGHELLFEAEASAPWQ